MSTPEEITGYWLDLPEKAYFSADPAFDAELKERFSGLLAEARAGALDGWAASPAGSLALIVVLDQMSRNIHRGTAEMFAGDAAALAHAKAAVGMGHDRTWPAAARRWYYMPFMHSEALADQETCVRLCGQPGLEATLPHAREHRDIVARFGRFPHRNRILGRTMSADEQAFLDGGGFQG